MNLIGDDDDFIDNLATSFGFKLAHMDTVNRFLDKLTGEQLEVVLKEIVSTLIAKKIVKSNHNLSNSHLVCVDGSGDGPASENDEGTTCKVSKNDKVSYSRSLLLASIVTESGFSIPIACEWIITEDGMKKQDCELNAFKRLSKKIKSFFPRLPICLLLDALYANAPVFDVCRQYDWQFVCSLKDNLVSLTRQAQLEFEYDDKQLSEKSYWLEVDGRQLERNVSWISDLEYTSHILTLITTTELDSKGKTLKFSYVTNICPTQTNFKSFVSAIRCRWNIEDTFNTLKNRGFAGLHKYARKSFSAYKNWRLIMLIAMVIEQLVVMSKQIAKIFDRANDTFTNLWKAMIVCLSDSQTAMIKINPRMKITYYR